MRKLYSIIFIFFALSFLCLPLMGQHTKNDSIEIKKDMLLDQITDIDKQLQEITNVDTIGGRAFRRMLNSYLEDLSNHPIYQLDRDKKGILRVPTDNWIPFDETTNFNDTVILNPAFLPVVFDGQILPENLTFLSTDTSFVNTANYQQYRLIDPENTFVEEIEQAKKTQNLRKKYYADNPEGIVYNGLAFDNSIILKEESKIKKNSIFSELLSTDDPIGISAPTLETLRIKKSHWKFTGEHSLQVAQNQLSDTWYGGGDNKFDFRNYHKVTLDYKRNKVTFDNRVEWRLNIRRTSADEKRKVGVTDDFFRTYSVFGVEAYKKWSYSANLEMNTPLFSGYKINSDDKLRAFLSPLDVNLGLGMRYAYEKTSEKDKYNNIKLGIDLSPLSIQYRYIKDTEVINGETNYGIEAGDNSKTELGSKIVGNLTWNFNRYANLTSSMTFFTNYERVQIDMINRFNYALNRYFSITVDLAMRFDDSVDKKDKTFGYLQYNETISFGLSYNW